MCFLLFDVPSVDLKSIPSLLQSNWKRDTNSRSACPKSKCLGQCVEAIRSDSNTVIGNCYLLFMFDYSNVM